LKKINRWTKDVEF